MSIEDPTPKSPDDDKPLDVAAFNEPHRQSVMLARSRDKELRTELLDRSGNRARCTPVDYCSEFVVNMHFLRRGLHHAAVNGVGTVLSAIKYCPWCGVPTHPEPPEEQQVASGG